MVYHKESYIMSHLQHQSNQINIVTKTVGYICYTHDQGQVFNVSSQIIRTQNNVKLSHNKNINLYFYSDFVFKNKYTKLYVINCVSNLKINSYYFFT